MAFSSFNSKLIFNTNPVLFKFTNLEQYLALYYPLTSSKDNITPNYKTGNAVYDGALGSSTISYLDTSFFDLGDLNLNTFDLGGLNLNNVMGSIATSYLESSSTFSLFPTNGLTISVWFSCSGELNTNGTIFSLPMDNINNELTISISGTNTIFSKYTSVYNGFNSVNLSSTTYGTIRFITINDNGNLIMTTSIGIFYSMNYGLNWQLSDAPSNDWLCVSLVNSGSALACTSSDVYYSSNNGVNWTITGAPTNVYTYNGIVLSSSGNAIVIASTSALYSNNYFSTWNGPVTLPTNSSRIHSMVGLASNGVGLVSGGQTLAITKNNGASWTEIPQSGSNPFWVNGSNVSDNGKYLVANNNTGAITYSTDYGTSWNLLGIPQNNAGRIIVGNNGVVINKNNQYGDVYKANLVTGTNVRMSNYRSNDIMAINPKGSIVVIVTKDQTLIVVDS